MIIEAATVCVGYGDFLAQVAGHNRRSLDRWAVATTPDDQETREVCSRFSLDCVLCEEFRRGGQFSKARGINAALRQLTGGANSWLVHLDADICLPYDFRQCIEDADLQEGNLYGCLRLCVPGWDTWQALQAQGLYSRQNGWLTEYRNRPPGCYVGGSPAGIGPGGNGYTPIGFFQMWYSEETLSWGHSKKWYPVVHGGAARTDTQFAQLWSRRRRQLIPELLVFHPEAVNAKDGMGHNWNGRKTPRFGPSRDELRASQNAY